MVITVAFFYLVCAGGIAVGVASGAIIDCLDTNDSWYSQTKRYIKRKRLMKTKKINSKEVCVICFEDFTDKHRHKAATLRGCNHVYHKKCLKRWLKERTVCPLCNIEL